MTCERIAKLFNYLYPTEQIRSFCCNDLYQELLNILFPKIGYVFYLYCSYSKYSRADIFRDKKSILYCPISILDIL